MKIYLVGGIIFIIGAILMAMGNYKNFEVERDGTIVNMTIQELPKICLGTKIKHYTKLIYKEQLYIKQVGANFCDIHKVGDIVEIRLLKGSDIVLFPNESTKPVFYMLGALGLIGIGLIGYYLKKSLLNKI